MEDSGKSDDLFRSGTAVEEKPYRGYGFKKGVKPNPGRQKGTPNKTSRMLKEALLIAANNAGGGGENGMINYLTQCALRYPTAFLPLLGRVLPMQFAEQMEDGTKVEVAVVRHVIIDADDVRQITDASDTEDSS